MAENGPIWRAESWWQQRADGVWLRWQPTSSTWEPQRTGPPPPAPPTSATAIAPVATVEIASQVAAHDPVLNPAGSAYSVGGRATVDILPAGSEPERVISGRSLRLRLAASAVVILVLLSGGYLLTRDKDSSKSLEAISLAAAQTRQAGTAKMAMTMSFGGMPSPTGADSMTMNASGAMDFAKNRGTMTMDMSSMVPAGMPGGGRVDMVFDDYVIYMQMPGISQFAGGKSWLKFDAAAMAQQQGIDLQSLSQFGNSDPTQGLQYLEGVSGDVEVLGEELVRGEPTTHYRTSVDLMKAAQQAPPELRDLAVQSTELIIDQLGVDSIPMEVWIDNAGLLRQIYYSMDMSGVEGMPEDVSLSITMQMYDFGSKVRIQIPPDFQVADIAELAGQMP